MKHTPNYLAIAALIGASLATHAQATTVAIPTPEGSYALWDTFTDANPGYPALEFSNAAPGSATTSAFSAVLSAAMSGSVTGGGDRIYNGVAASAAAFGLTIDGTATVALTELTLVLKITPPSVSSGFTNTNFFNVSLNGGEAATGTFLWNTGETIGSGENANPLGIVSFTWEGLSINPSDTFNIAITSPADGHVSVDSIQLSQSIPEPSAALLGGIGMLGLLRRKRSA